MTQMDSVTAVLIDGPLLTLEELAGACGMRVQWVVQKVQDELLGATAGEPMSWRFGSAELTRCRRLAGIEQMFEVNQEAAAFMVDLIEEVAQLRRQLRLAQAGGPHGAAA
jgi:hypothetical protein